MKSDGFQDKAHPYRASLFGKNKTEISFDIQFCQTPPYRQKQHSKESSNKKD
jgi:hypothetical protein